MLQTNISYNLSFSFHINCRYPIYLSLLDYATAIKDKFLCFIPVVLCLWQEKKLQHRTNRCCPAVRLHHVVPRAKTALFTKDTWFLIALIPTNRVYRVRSNVKVSMRSKAEADTWTCHKVLTLQPQCFKSLCISPLNML